MPGTMDKADVKLSYEPLSDVDWSEVAKVVGKAVPQLCKTTVDEVLDGVKTRKYKKPYGKVGLIKKDLYFRIKDGSTHVDDILLVKNWTEPEGGEIELTKSQEEALDEWIQSRKDLLRLTEEGYEAAKESLKTLESDCELISTYLSMAKQGMKDTITGTGLESNARKAAELILEIENIVASINKIHDDDVFPTYDEHRTVTTPDVRHGLPQESYGEYGKTYFLQVVGPVYKKLDEIRKRADALFDGAKKDYQLLVRWSAEGASELENYAEEAANIRDQVSDEFKRMKAEEGMSPFNNLENGLLTDTKNLSTYGPELLDRLLDNATGKITKAKETMKRILARQTTINEQVARVKKIPKQFQGAHEIKDILVEIARLQQQVVAYVKEMGRYLLDGIAQFEKFRKEYEKKVH